MSCASPPILIIPERSDWENRNGLPSDSDNLFERLIRNPRIESDNPRERECTEMVCAVLRNCRGLRTYLFRWLAELACHRVPDLDALDFAIDTEQPIESKRDDLRIRGWRSNDNEEQLALLWTVEVKVGADFHESSSINLPAVLIGETVGGEQGGCEVASGSPIKPVESETSVHQVTNYDDWLVRQSACQLAGFVLAIDDMTERLPSGLKCLWRAITWTELACTVEAAIASESLAQDELLLARHMIGFIRKHLWSSTNMSLEPLDFDDVAFLRAFARMAFDTEKKINRLVAPLVSVLDSSGVGNGQVWYQKDSLLKGMVRCIVGRNLFDVAISRYPILMMGVHKDSLAIWLETPAGNEKKEMTLQAIDSVRTKFRSEGWKVFSDASSGYDIELRAPLTAVLTVQDHEAFVTDFFASALEDIKQAGMVEAIEQALRKQ